MANFNARFKKGAYICRRNLLRLKFIFYLINEAYEFTKTYFVRCSCSNCAEFL